jgi:nitroreductase
MDVIDIIKTRREPAKLTEPMPSDALLSAAFTAAATAPDHKMLRPWRFLKIEGDARKEFGELMAKSLKARQPDADAASVEREKSKALRAPLIVVAVASIKTGAPEVEQLLAAGAAVQNFTLALHGSGFGSFWRTGAPAYDNIVKQGLGIDPKDHIVGFIYVGTVGAMGPEKKRQTDQEIVSDWSRAH